MSKTDKTKPIDYQIKDHTAVYGDIRNSDWRAGTFKYRRSNGEREYYHRSKTHKYVDWKDDYDY